MKLIEETISGRYIDEAPKRWGGSPQYRAPYTWTARRRSGVCWHGVWAETRGAFKCCSKIPLQAFPPLLSCVDKCGFNRLNFNQCYLKWIKQTLIFFYQYVFCTPKTWQLFSASGKQVSTTVAFFDKKVRQQMHKSDTFKREINRVFNSIKLNVNKHHYNEETCTKHSFLTFWAFLK